MRSKCEPPEQLRSFALATKMRFGIIRMKSPFLAGACLVSISVMLPLTSAFADDLNGRDSRAKILLSDNTGYDGASLPAPAKKKNQVTLSGDDTPDDTTPQKRHHNKRQDADASSDGMSSSDATAGATLPSPKKSTRPSDGQKPSLANEKDGRPGLEKRGGGGGHDAGMFGKGPLDLTALSLTDEQKQKIAQMHADNGGKMRDLMRKRRELSVQMRDLMFDADVTEAQIRAKRDEVRQVQEKLEDLRLNDFLGIRSVLTAEQKQKLKEVKIANRPRDGEASPNAALPKRAEGEQKNEPKRLADTQNK